MDENCALLGDYAASSGNFLRTFPGDNQSVPSSGKNCALQGYYAASSGNFLRTFREKTYRSRLQGRTALFRVITQRVVVISCRHLGTTYRSHLQGSRGQET